MVRSVFWEERLYQVKLARAAGTALIKELRSTMPPDGWVGPPPLMASTPSPGGPLASESIFRLRFLHLQMNSRAKIITAAPATLLTTLPIITGVGVAGPESEPELFPEVPVLEAIAPEANPVPLPLPIPPPPAAPKAPSPVDVGCDEELGEYKEDVETVIESSEVVKELENVR